MVDFTFGGLPNAPAPASYAAPLLSFQPLGDLGKSYFEGTQEKNTLDKQQLFRNGIPRDPSGNLDLNKITDMVAKTGGYEGVAPLIGQAMQLKAGSDLANAGAPQQGQPGQPPPAPAANGGPTAAPAPGQPTLSATGSDVGDQGAPTIRSMVTEFGGGKEMTPVISQIVRQLRINPDGPLNAGQAGQVKQLYAQLNGGAGTAQSPGQPGDQPAQAPAAVSAPQPGSPAGVLQGDSIAASQALRDRAANIQRYATAYANINKPAAEEAQKTSAALSAQADKMDERLSTASKRPADIQEKQIEEQNKDDVTRYGKQLSGIQASASTANRMLDQYVPLAEAIYNDPNVKTGVGENWDLAWKKVKNLFDPGNTESLGQEAYRKVTAGSVLNQVEQLKDDTSAVGGGGRIFQAQLQLMQEAAGSPDNTLPALRTLTEIAKRAALASKEVAKMANAYKGGHLDAAFAQKVDDYFSDPKHAMFRADELADIRRVAPPLVKTPADLQKIGWKDGQPFKTPDGKIFTHAPPGWAPPASAPARSGEMRS